MNEPFVLPAPRVCPVCGKQYSNDGGLRQHRIMKHSAPGREPHPKDGRSRARVLAARDADPTATVQAIAGAVGLSPERVRKILASEGRPVRATKATHTG